ncbi:MAG: phosphotransferase family protein [Candidatus Dormibacteria bacterium]
MSPPTAESTPVSSPVRVFSSLEELLARVTARRPFKTSDSLSGSQFESVECEGERMVVKYVSVDHDWIMRASGDLNCRQLTLFASGLMDRLPASIDHATVAVAPFVTSSGHRGGALLMKDVSLSLVPPGSTRIDADAHLRFLDHMSQLHALYWGWHGAVELFPLAHHFVLFTPTMAMMEKQRRSGDAVPPAVAGGWARMRQGWPVTYAALREIVHDPGPLASALSATPQTFIHADWKLGNLGERSDGRTILLDWDRCGSAPATLDLAWYLAVNCDRLPQSKEETIDAYRCMLAQRGVEVGAWWPRQLALALLAGFLMLGWSKTGDAAEFGWWDDRLAEGLRWL